MLELVAAFLGALVGGFFALWGARLQSEIQRKRRVRSLSAALSAEIGGLVHYARRSRYEIQLRAVAENVRSPSFVEGQFPAFAVPVTHSYFSVFEANAGDIGELEPKLVVEVIAFYQKARGWLDSLSLPARPDGGAHSRTEISEHFKFLADSIALICEFGDGLAARLAPASISKHILHTARALDLNAASQGSESPQPVASERLAS